MENPLKYSDLIAPDDSIDKLIDKLEQLNKTYSQMIKPMINEAKSLREELSRLAPTNEENRRQIETSAKKVDDLAKAQERLKKAMSDNAQQIAALNVQAKEQNAINELNAKYFVSSAGSYDEMTASLARLKLQYQALSQQERENTDMGKELAHNIAQINAQIKEYNATLKEATKQEELKQRILNNAVGSYNKIAAQYEMLKLKINAMGEAEKKDIDIKRKLEERAKALYTQMIKLQEATGKHQLSVGNYAKSWDGLRFSIFQVVRELPNAAVSLNTLFLALSNNIPIVADELQMLRQRNEELRAQGKPTESALKSVVGALFSFNSALIIVITALTMYGDKIVGFIKDTINFGTNVKSAKEAMSAIADELEKTTGNYGRNITALKELSAEWGRLTSQKDKLQFIKDNKSAFDQLDVSIRNVADAENLLVNNTKYMIRALQLRAKMVAAEKLAAEEYENALRLQVKMEQEDYSPNTLDTLFGYFSKVGGGFWAQLRKSRDKKNKNESEINASAYTAIASSLKEMIEDLYKEAGFEESHKGKTKTKRTKEAQDISVQLQKIINDVNEAFEKSETLLMSEGGYNQKLKKVEDEVHKTTNTLDLLNTRIDKWLSNPKKYKLTDEQRKILADLKEKISATKINVVKGGTIQSDNIGRAYQADAIAFDAKTKQADAENAKESGMASGVVQSARKQAAIVQTKAEMAELERAYAIRKDLIAKGDKDELDKQNKFIAERAIIKRKGELALLKIDIESAMERFDHEQKMEKLDFESVEQTERDKTLFMIKQQRERIKKILAVNKTLSPEQKAELRGQLNVLDFQEKEAKKPKDIFDVFGFNLTDEKKQLINQSVSYMADAMNTLMQLEEAYAQKAVDNANKRVQAAQNALIIEKEARANGYANNVEMAQKEYEAGKKQQEKAIRQQKRIQKQQLAIDTATQISSLVTSTAQIWKSFTGMGPAGPALAIAATALMWGSFAASKIMAAKLMSAKNDEEYGEGTIELLQGGSHQSGNDIDLGRKADGTRRRAEGGEYFAVINKRNSRKYRKDIPDIIHALNSGTFENKYMLAEKKNAELGKYISAYDKAGNVTLNVERSKVDLTKLQNGVNMLVKQGERRSVTTPEGEVTYYKNVKRLIRA